MLSKTFQPTCIYQKTGLFLKEIQIEKETNIQQQADTINVDGDDKEEKLNGELIDNDECVLESAGLLSLITDNDFFVSVMLIIF